MRRIALSLALLTALPAGAATLTVGMVAGSCGGQVSVPVTIDQASGLLAVEFRVAYDTTRFVAGQATAGSAVPGFSISSNAAGGVLRVAMASGSPAPAGSGTVALLTFTVGASAPQGTAALSISDILLNDQVSPGVNGAVTVTCGGTTTGGTWLLPSSARASGAGGAFYTTDLTIANGGSGEATVTVKFLGNSQDGRNGPEKNYTLPAGRGITLGDVLGSAFSLTSGFGAILVRSTAPGLVVLGQTSTPGSGGTFGQSVPAFGPGTLLTSGFSKSIAAIREDASFRTNLVLANATESDLYVDARLVLADGITVGPKAYGVPPLGMIQVSRVVRDMGATGDVTGARLVLSASTAGASWAAYASVIDNGTNDPRTLLPQ